MKVSEVIKDLQKALDEHGDLPVRYNDSFNDRTVAEITPYTKEGNCPDDENAAAEIYIH